MPYIIFRIFRSMQNWRDQLRSLRIQDTYIMECRHHGICVLDEIRNFSFRYSSINVPSNGKNSISVLCKP